MKRYIVESWVNNRKKIPIKREEEFDSMESASKYFDFAVTCAKDKGVPFMAMVYCVDTWELPNGKTRKKQGANIRYASNLPTI